MSLYAWTTDDGSSAVGPSGFTAGDLAELDTGELLVAHNTGRSSDPPNKTVTRAELDAIRLQQERLRLTPHDFDHEGGTMMSVSDDLSSADTSPRCPECGAASLPIVWGLPGPSFRAAFEAGLLRVGGCMIPDATPMPNWSCIPSSHQHYDADDDRWNHAIDSAIQPQPS